MPQEFQILRCCDCEKFQVHHVKKAQKWQCKVCGLKQSMKRAYFIGSSRDCRVNVQKLNFQAGEQEMKRKLGESCSSVDDENPSLERGNEDFAFSVENEVDEFDWIDQNDGMDESDWVDENLSENVYNRKSESDSEDELPKKKQRCESYLESEESYLESENDNCINPNEDVKNQGGFVLLSMLNCQQGENSSKAADSANNISRTDVPKVEKKEKSNLTQDREENSLTGVAKSRSNSVLKPTHGFQLILNEAKKQRTDLDYDLDL